jgi:hypothetical protein
VCASTPNQALGALLYHYRKLLERILELEQTVRDGKDRLTLLPQSLVASLQAHLL